MNSGRTPPYQANDEQAGSLSSWQSRDGISEVEDLGLFIDGVPHTPPARNLGRRKVWLLASGSFALLVVLLTAGVFVTQAITRERTADITTLPVLAGTPVPQGAEAIAPQNVDHLTEFARWGRGAATQLAFSPDGRTLAVASSIGIYLYAYSPSGAILNRTRFIETAAWIWSVAFSPDGQTLASGSSTGKIWLWKVSDGTLMHSVDAHIAQVNSIAFSPDGQVFASASADGTVKIWHTSDGTLVRALHSSDDSPTWIYSLAFSPDGETLVSTRSGGAIQFWRVEDGSPIRTLGGLSGTIGNLAFSSDSKVLASAPFGAGVQLWNMTNGSLLGEIDAERSGGGGMALSADGQMVAATSGSDDMISIWRTDNRSILHTLDIHDVRYSGTKSLTFSPDGQIFASASGDGTIRLWRVADWSLLYGLDGDSYWGEKIAYSPDGKIIASASDDGKLQLWNASDGVPLRTIQGADHAPEYLLFSPDSLLITEILYTPQGSSTWTWHVSDGSLFRNYDITEGSLVLMAISPDAEAFATQARGGTVKVWKVQDGTLLGVVDTSKGAGGVTGRMALSSGGQILACALMDDRVELWETGDSTFIRTLKSTRAVDSLMFSPDSQTLVGVSGWQIAVWRVQDGAPTQLPHTQFIGEEDRLTNIVFSPDSRLVAGINNVSSDPTIWLWSTNNSWLFDIRYLHNSNVNSVAFAPDGQTLVSVSGDRTVRLWRISSNKGGTTVSTPKP